MSNFDVFFFDVDGTLIDSNTHKISESTLAALTELQNKGKKIVVCTGRSYASAMKIEELRKVNWDGFILSNGAVVADKEGNELYRFTFDRETLLKMERITDESGILFYYVGKEEFLNRPMNEYVEKAFDFFGGYSESYDIHPYINEKVTMAMAFDCADSDYGAVRAVDELSVLATKHCYADVTGKGIDKGKGLAMFCEAMNISLENSMAFGDGINDLEMIETAGVGVVMGNGVDAMKQIADYVTDSVDHDGIYKALKFYEQI